MCVVPSSFFFFFFNDTATTEIYTLSLHDALPISGAIPEAVARARDQEDDEDLGAEVLRLRLTAQRLLDVQSPVDQDRKSTRLNSSHGYISYAVFCLKKKKKNIGC